MGLKSIFSRKKRDKEQIIVPGLETNLSQNKKDVQA
jgi:hypothetical protein